MGGREVGEWKGWPGVSEPLPGARLRVLSLGAGVQSSTLALMAARGEIGPMPDCAIFADTGWEPQGVYDWLDWLEAQLPFPVHRVSKGSIRAAILRKSGRSEEGDRSFSAVPFFTSTGGMGRRQCTREFKIEPIQRKIRELLGLKPRQVGPKVPVVEQWIGISRDEMSRMKDAKPRYIKNRWPLIELGMDRAACLKWMADRQYPTPAKSACIGCPFHDDAMWRAMKIDDPASWADAVLVDAAIRKNGTQRGFADAQYMHRSLMPLSDVDFDSVSVEGNLFEECDGVCFT